MFQPSGSTSSTGPPLLDENQEMFLHRHGLLDIAPKTKREEARGLLTDYPDQKCIRYELQTEIIPAWRIFELLSDIIWKGGNSAIHSNYQYPITIFRKYSRRQKEHKWLPSRQRSYQRSPYWTDKGFS